MILKYQKNTVIEADYQNIAGIDQVKIKNYLVPKNKRIISYVIIGGRDKSNNQIRNKNNRKVSDLSDATVSDSDKRDGGPMRYLRHQRSRNRLQDEEPKTQKVLSDGKNVKKKIKIRYNINKNSKYCMYSYYLTNLYTSSV